jgi:hypothetical protein
MPPSPQEGHAPFTWDAAVLTENLQNANGSKNEVY